MSRCPDARRAEERFNDVLAIVSSIADIRTIYIAQEDPDKPENVTCMHGPAECAGNIQQLCAAAYGRARRDGDSSDPSKSRSSLGWSFLMCQNDRFQDIGSPELAESCLKDAGFSSAAADLARACWSGSEGWGRLSASAAEARVRDATRSCTIYIGGEYRCTHDGAKWYDCPGGSDVDDFVTSVCISYRQITGEWPEEVCGDEV